MLFLGRSTTIHTVSPLACHIFVLFSCYVCVFFYIAAESVNGMQPCWCSKCNAEPRAVAIVTTTTTTTKSDDDNDNDEDDGKTTLRQSEQRNVHYCECVLLPLLLLLVLVEPPPSLAHG